MFPVDQLFCDKGKLRYNEPSLVGQIVVICLRGLHSVMKNSNLAPFKKPGIEKVELSIV